MGGMIIPRCGCTCVDGNFANAYQIDLTAIIPPGVFCADCGQLSATFVVNVVNCRWDNPVAHWDVCGDRFYLTLSIREQDANYAIVEVVLTGTGPNFPPSTGTLVAWKLVIQRPFDCSKLDADIPQASPSQLYLFGPCCELINPGPNPSIVAPTIACHVKAIA